MINDFKNILFFADGAKGEKAALIRARKLAADNGAKLTVMDVVAEASSNDHRLHVSIRKLQQSLIKERLMALDQLIASLPAVKSKLPSLERRVVPGKGYVEVIKAVMDKKFDLLIKSSKPGFGLVSSVFGNNDIRLLHHCPCPVLILKPSRRKTFRSILAAVDPVTENKVAMKLNANIMDASISISDIEAAALHVLHVWDLPIPGHMAHRIHKNEMQALQASLAEDTRRKMTRLVDDYTGVTFEEHVLKGKPQRLIPQFVKKNDIDLLVMGTVSRSGVPGFLVGNTAEKILNRVDCSVLALKPMGWKSPVR